MEVHWEGVRGDTRRGVPAILIPFTYQAADGDREAVARIGTSRLGVMARTAEGKPRGLCQRGPVVVSVVSVSPSTL